MRDYQYVSPSLDGVLQHASTAYEGVYRPTEVLRIMDGPAIRGQKKEAQKMTAYSADEQKIIHQYFQDLYSVFIKKLSHFAVAHSESPEEDVVLQAMLQELIKIRKLLSDRKTSSD